MPKIPRVMVDGKLVLVQSRRMAEEHGVLDQWQAHTSLPSNVRPLTGGAVEQRIKRELAQGRSTDALIEEVGPGVLLSPVIQKAIQAEQRQQATAGPVPDAGTGSIGATAASFDPLDDPTYPISRADPAQFPILGNWIGGRQGRVVFTVIKNRQISGIRMGRLPQIIFENRLKVRSLR